MRSGDDELALVIRSAFYAAFPIYRAMQIRQTHAFPMSALGAAAMGRLVHGRTLKDHAYREHTAPNNDTLYSFAWLDLTNGDAVLRTPTLKDRYHSVALLDLFSDNIAVLGSRNTKGEAGEFSIVGPSSKAKDLGGSSVIRAPTNDVWMIVRVLVRDREDLSEACAAQDGFHLAAKENYDEPSVTNLEADIKSPERFLRVVNSALGRSPLPEKHRARLDALAGAGIRPGEADVWSRLPRDVRARWQADFRGCLASLRAGRERLVVRDGWAYPEPGIGDFGQDDRYRAQVALFGFGALPREEAIYVLSVQDASGQSLYGRHMYRLTVPADVPINGFWSLSLYEVAGDRRLFFVENPLNRYAIGDRSVGLERNDDGSVDITIAKYNDEWAGSPNFLPSPAGSFRLIFRAYLPGAAFLNNQFALPPVRKLERR